MMANRLGWISGLGVGAGIMYALDPDRGRRRRALVRDQMLHQLHRGSNGVDVAARDLLHRGQGIAARAKRSIQRHEVDNEILVARVRSRLGRLVSHPHAIEVLAERGRITLRGLILDEELAEALSHLNRVSGVRSIENQLKAYRKGDQVPALQGGRPKKGDRFELLQENWSPAARFLVSLGSAAPIAMGLKRRGIGGFAMTGIGLGFMLRAMSNQELGQFLGVGRRGAIHVHKAIQIDAPPEDVFRFWTDFDNFGQFLPEVIEVRAQGQNRSRWVVSGPGGVPIRWNAITTRFEPNRVIAWRSEPGAIIQNSGRIQFLPVSENRTKIEMDFFYRPPIGRLGHWVARFFGADPKSQIDDALLRVKSLIERGPSRRLQRIAAGA